MNENITTKIEAIVSHFIQNQAADVEAPEHWEKTNEELVNLGFDGKLTKDEYNAILAYKASRTESPSEAHRKMLMELVTMVAPPRKRNPRDLTSLDLNNKKVFEKLGFIWKRSLCTLSMKKFLQGQGQGYAAFHKANAENFEAALIQLAGDEANLKKLIKKEYDAIIKLNMSKHEELKAAKAKA